MIRLNQYYSPPPSVSMKTSKGACKTKVIGLGSLYPIFNTYSTPNKLKSNVTSVPNLECIVNSTQTKLTYTPYNSTLQ